MKIQAFKKRFDPVLERLLVRILDSYQSLIQDAFILEMVNYSRALLLSGGKRVRPYIAWLAYKAAGGKADTKALQIFTGLELFHAFALVHDDIMDHGTERHGIKTAHRYVSDRLRELRRHGDAMHLGVSQAILIGDLLFAWATHQVAGTNAWNVFRLMIDEVMIGQMIDIDVMTRCEVDDQLLYDKMQLKTASYTFVRPMQIGIMLAQNEKRNTKNFMRFSEEYGLPLGMAFQIQDDLLDLILPSKDSGKTTLSDLREGNHTIFTQFVRMRGTKAQKRELESMVGAALTEKDRARVVALFTEAGAIDHGRALIEGYFESALEAIERAGFQAKHAKSFRELVEYIRARAK